MPANQPSKNPHLLCHEHLLEMRLNPSFLNSGGDGTRAIAYTCMEPDWVRIAPCFFRRHPEFPGTRGLPGPPHSYVSRRIAGMSTGGSFSFPD